MKKWLEVLFVLCGVWLTFSSHGINRVGDTTKVDSLLIHAGNIQNQFPDSAWNIFAKAEELANQSKDSIALMKLLNYRGVSYYNKADHDQAAKFYFEALTLGEKYHKQHFIGLVSNNLGSVYFDLGELAKADSFYNKAYDVMQHFEDNKWLSNITGNLAGVAFRQQDYEGAISLLKVSISHGLKAKNYTAVGGAYSNLAMVYMALKRKEDALATFDTGIGMLKEVGDKRGVCVVLLQLSRLQNQLGDNTAAISTADQVIESATEIEYKEAISQGHLLLSQYIEISDLEKSLFHLKAHLRWKDSVINEERLRLVTEMDEKYKSQKQQAAIEVLETKNQNKQLANNKQSLQILILIILVCGISIIGLLSFKQLKAKRRANQVLVEKNEVIAQSLNDKSLLMREVHHRVKNNFQLLSGLLILKSQGTTNNEVQNAMMEMRQRLQSMAATHTRLYQSEADTRVNVQEFIGSLLEELQDLNLEDECEISIAIQPIHLPVDIALNIGLIISEFVTNSFKHAFHEVKCPKLNVQIKRTNDSINLDLVDNGTGFDIGNENGSFGLKLIDKLATQLGGTTNWSSNNGTGLQLEFEIK